MIRICKDKPQDTPLICQISLCCIEVNKIEKNLSQIKMKSPSISTSFIITQHALAWWAKQACSQHVGRAQAFVHPTVSIER